MIDEDSISVMLVVSLLKPDSTFEIAKVHGFESEEFCPVTLYYPNGVVRCTYSTNRMGYAIGIYREFDTNGHLICIGELSKHISDSIFERVIIRNEHANSVGCNTVGTSFGRGIKTGQWLYFSPSGCIIQVNFFEEDEMVGVVEGDCDRWLLCFKANISDSFAI